MRAAAHVLATLVVAPYVALATGFLLLGHLISQGTLGGLLLALVDVFIWMVPWGVLALVAALGLVMALFFFPRTRRLASIGLGAIAALSLLVIMVVPGGCRTRDSSCFSSRAWAPLPSGCRTPHEGTSGA